MTQSVFESETRGPGIRWTKATELEGSDVIGWWRVAPGEEKRRGLTRGGHKGHKRLVNGERIAHYRMDARMENRGGSEGSSGGKGLRCESTVRQLKVTQPREYAVSNAVQKIRAEKKTTIIGSSEPSGDFP